MAANTSKKRHGWTRMGNLSRDSSCSIQFVANIFWKGILSSTARSRLQCARWTFRGVTYSLMGCDNGNWNLSNFPFPIPEDLRLRVLNTLVINQEEKADQVAWGYSRDGLFSSKSAYLLQENQPNANPVLQKLRKVNCHNRWNAPPAGWFKVNCDAAVNNPGFITYGGVIRDSMGKWLSGFCGKMEHGTVNRGEIWSTVKGIKLAIELQIDYLIVESESLLAVHFLSHDCLISHHWSTLHDVFRRVQQAEGSEDIAYI
ncbi:hypothetical protein L6164_026474 [Bauhinia variegata]|uniref:Uncharacterized protein n=1 Tax=Bauhinia variegata TaxID=167791 RepID=A0ACB9LQI5_BAUVA|nr:hypothetical protein L6164_026474 [Bauhinia variegata]